MVTSATCRLWKPLAQNVTDADADFRDYNAFHLVCPDYSAHHNSQPHLKVVAYVDDIQPLL